MTRRYRLTEAADDDIVQILSESARVFGPQQRDAYARLLERAVEMIATEPEWPASHAREELGPGVRSFHVELAAGRRGAAAHAIYYRRGTLEDGSDGIIVLRILHERMDPLLHSVQQVEE
jgi:toxin ParE1/3/4